MSHDALSPDQFGFKTVPHEEWTDAMEAAYHGTKADYQNRRVNPSRLELHTGQDAMYPEAVEQYVRAPRRHQDDARVEVIEHGGKLYQGEGHHRMAAARRAGRKSIRVEWWKTGE